MHKIRTMLKTVLAVVTASVMGTGILAGLVPMTSFAKEGAKINIVYNSGPAGAGTATQAYTEGTVKQLKSPEDLGWNYAGHRFRGWKDEDGTFYSPGESLSDWSTGTAYIRKRVGRHSGSPPGSSLSLRNGKYHPGGGYGVRYSDSTVGYGFIHRKLQCQWRIRQHAESGIFMCGKLHSA